MTPLDPAAVERLRATVRARDLALEPERAEALAPPVGSLLARLAALARVLPPETELPPAGARRSTSRATTPPWP